MTTEQIIAQIISIVAVIIYCISFYGKSKKYFLIYQILLSFLYLAIFILLDARVAWICVIIGLVRFIIYYLFEKYKAGKKFYIPTSILFGISVLVILILFWQTPFDICMLFANFVYIFIFIFNDIRVIKAGYVFADINFTIYNLVNMAYVASIGNMLAIINAIIFFIIDGRKRKKISLSK